MTAFGDAVAAGHRLVVDDRLDGDRLDPTVWIPWYLPHWAGRERSAARYRLERRCSSC